MRYYLKKCKAGGYWSCERCIQRGSEKKVEKEFGKTTVTIIQMKDQNAELRTDDDFLTYCSDRPDNKEDNHCTDSVNPSPFHGILPLVTGFVLDPMHTFIAGNFGRRIHGLVSSRSEGQLSSSLKQRIDDRITLYGQCKPLEFDRKLRNLKSAHKYKHHELRNFLLYYLFPVLDGILDEKELNNIVILQHAWLLIGGSSSELIPAEDTAEASSILKLYQQELIECISMTHASQHIVEDVINYKCGVERNAAWMFENIQHIFTRALRTGFKPVAQIRNRFIERYKYRLPTLGNGTVMNCYDLFQEEVEKASFVQNKAQVVTKWKIGKGSNPKSHFPYQLIRLLINFQIMSFC